MALFRLDKISSSIGFLSEELSSALHTIDQLLLRRRSCPDAWDQLLLQVFGRSAALNLDTITIVTLNRQGTSELPCAYTSVTPQGEERIYIDEDWLKTANSEEIQDILLQGLGHIIGNRLNKNNYLDDNKWATFSALIHNQAIDKQIAREKETSDIITTGHRKKTKNSAIQSKYHATSRRIDDTTPRSNENYNLNMNVPNDAEINNLTSDNGHKALTNIFKNTLTLASNGAEEKPITTANKINQLNSENILNNFKIDSNYLLPNHIPARCGCFFCQGVKAEINEDTISQNPPQN